MSFFANIFKDPPPTHAFELSEDGIAFVEMSHARHPGFVSFDPGVLVASPAHDNIQQPQVVQQRIQSISPPNGHRKRPAALILPDYCARVAVLDFDAFPVDRSEQLALLRFRMKKSVPFDVDSAMVSFAPQNRAGGGKVEVLTAVMAAEIVGRYEAPFRAAGFHPGLVTTSSLAALNLIDPAEITMLVKLAGHILSVFVLQGSGVKLARCVEMDSSSVDDIESVLHPTMAYIEDELKASAKRIWTCGLGAQGAALMDRWHTEWNVAFGPLQSRFGTPGANNAGLFGYLESVGAG